jgi:hypothetical protein
MGDGKEEHPSSPKATARLGVDSSSSSIDDNGDDDGTTAPEKDLGSVLQETERSFLRKEYRQSLGLVHRWFRNQRQQPPDAEHPSPQGHTVRLVPSIRIPLHPNNHAHFHNSTDDDDDENYGSFAFVADLATPDGSSPAGSQDGQQCHTKERTSNETTATARSVDQLAVIGLQSWYELSRLGRRQQRNERQRRGPGMEAADTPNHDRWIFVVEILEYYSHRNEHYGATHSLPTNTVASDREPLSPLAPSKHPGMPRGRLSLELLATVWISFWESQGVGLVAFA